MQIVESLPTTTFPESLVSGGTTPNLRVITPIQQRAVEAAVVDAGITQPAPRTPIRDLVGADVYYVLYDGQRRPAVVVRDWGNNMVNLQVFTDGLNDFATGDPGSDGILWATSVHYAPAASMTPGTWHWRMETL